MRGNTYGREYEKQPEFPKELALLIARKAHRMAERFEDQCLDTMIRDAKRALRRGTDPLVIATQMEL
ncbi:hypothetical protein SAMN05216201_107101 [Pseudomonas linyingensis]|uniref:Uncharacterized protein n=1 Tax=Pseudomonas linyingensis TaxID=915471 RepID=A0A1H6XXZ1_9PSED|nr:hypothetical protein [Pseudomonas linyingensis]SEJ33909.1 hypothetical protein SAMN05216201_107101 [Pseudomonas linyingensis]